MIHIWIDYYTDYKSRLCLKLSNGSGSKQRINAIWVNDFTHVWIIFHIFIFIKDKIWGIKENSLEKDLQLSLLSTNYPTQATFS